MSKQDARPDQARELVAHCKRGHRFTKKNTYRKRDGYRQCRRCKAANEAARRAR